MKCLNNGMSKKAKNVLNQIVKIDKSGDFLNEEDLPVIDFIESNIADKDLADDYFKARLITDKLLGIGMESLERLARVADMNESAREYEVLATFIKALGDLNSDRLSLHEKIEKIRTAKIKNKTSQKVSDGEIGISNENGESLSMIDILNIINKNDKENDGE